MSAHQFLRDRTQASHLRVDSLFSAFDLSERASYRRFLRAQCRAVLPLEMLLVGTDGLPAWERRSPALLEDLRSLEDDGDLHAGFARMSALNHGEGLGSLYVLEGSRFGAAVLKKRVGPGLPTRFLTARAGPNWRDLLLRLEAGAAEDPHPWLEDLVSGASVAYAAFAAAAVEELHPQSTLIAA